MKSYELAGLENRGGFIKMEDNLARELEVEEDTLAGQSFAQQIEQPYERVAPSVTPIPQSEPLPKGLTKLEMGLVGIIGIILFSFILLNVHTSLELNTASRDLQDVNRQVAQTNIEIENLSQQAHELSRYDRIQEIAEKYGLELHNENIINIAPQE